MSASNNVSDWIVVAVQSRMSSSRLPAKALADVNGAPLLSHCVARCRDANVGTVVIATSDHEEDDAIELLGKNIGIPVFRGSLYNVIERFHTLAKQYQAKYVVRVSGDSPFIDPQLIRTAVQLAKAKASDLVSNVVTRTFPKGQSVEVLSRDTLVRLDGISLSEYDKEHVTSCIYANPSDFRILSFESGGSFGDIQLSVDTANDLECARRIAIKMTSNQISWRDLVTLRRSVCG